MIRSNLIAHIVKTGLEHLTRTHGHPITGRSRTRRWREASRLVTLCHAIPICSMYGIFTYIYLIYLHLGDFWWQMLVNHTGVSVFSTVAMTSQLLPAPLRSQLFSILLTTFLHTSPVFSSLPSSDQLSSPLLNSSQPLSPLPTASQLVSTLITSCLLLNSSHLSSPPLNLSHLFLS